MSDAGLAEQLEPLKNALRIILEHVGMSTDARRQVKIHLGDLVPEPPPPADPRDAAIAELQRQLAAAQASPPSPQASAGESPAAMAEPEAAQPPAEATPVPEPAPESEALPAEPINAQVFPAERSE